MSTENRWEELSNRINRIIESVPLNRKKVYLARQRKLSGLPAAHLINSSALPDKHFHPRYQPIILYLHAWRINTLLNIHTFANIISVEHCYLISRPKFIRYHTRLITLRRYVCRGTWPLTQYTRVHWVQQANAYRIDDNKK